MSNSNSLDKLSGQRKLEMLMQPHKNMTSVRELLRAEYGIPEPKAQQNRPNGGLVKFGVRKKGFITKHGTVLSRDNRLDPSRPLPPITEQDLKKGIFSLINRGLIPQQMDTTAAFRKSPAPVTQEVVQLHRPSEKHQKRELQTSSFGYDLANIKLDVLNELQISRLADNRQIMSFDEPDDVTEDVESEVQDEAPFPTDEVEERIENQQLFESEHKEPISTEITLPEVQFESPDAENEGPRTYGELMDSYSLHQFIIRRGQTLDSTPEFISFQRTYFSRWGNIVTIIRMLEKFVDDVGVRLAIIDGKQVAQLAENELELPTQAQLLSCLTNTEQIPQQKLQEIQSIDAEKKRLQPSTLSQQPRPSRVTKQSEHLAAIMIQKTWKMYRQRINYKELRKRNQIALMLTRRWHLHKQHKQTRMLIAQQLRIEEEEWRTVMENFATQWSRVKNSKRVILHIPSLSYDESLRNTISQFHCYQNSQLARLVDLADPNVEVIYVPPYQIDEEAIQYYIKLLSAVGVQGLETRLKIIQPDHMTSMKSTSTTTSLSRSILFSSRTLKRIRTQIRGKDAYMIPRIVGQEELHVAMKLKIPMLAPDPYSAQVYSTKSGAKRIFAAAEVNTAIGCYDLYEESEILIQLSKLIVTYPEYGRWLFKLDNEFSARGIAYMDVHKLKCLSDESIHQLRSEISKNGRTVSLKDILRDKIYFELRSSISKYVKFVNKFVYKTWESFIAAVEKSGAVIEACPRNIVGCPCVNLFIDPNGNTTIISTQEQILSPFYHVIGASFPQKCIPHEVLRDAALTVASCCYAKKVIGYLTIDFIVFVTEEKQFRLWAVDLKLGLTDNAVHHQLFSFACGVTMDSQTGELLDSKTLLRMNEKKEKVKKAYIYSGLIRHPSMKLIRHNVFFSLCRQKGISFDVQKRTGVLFQLVDSLLKGMLGILCVGSTMAESVSEFSSVTEFIVQQVADEDLQASEQDTNIPAIIKASRVLVERCINSRKLLKDRDRFQSPSQ